MWNLATGHFIDAFPIRANAGHEQHAWQLTFTPTGNHLLYADLTKTKQRDNGSTGWCREVYRLPTDINLGGALMRFGSFHEPRCVAFPYQ